MDAIRKGVGWLRRELSPPKGPAIERDNPVVGDAEDAPRLAAGPLRSPRFLGTEAEYFAEARRMIDTAQPGDAVCLQMYELENVATNGEASAAKQAPGFADQQALLPGLAAAAARGVRVDVVLDASRARGGEGKMNQPVVDWLDDHASPNLHVDYYPAETVNIDHAKELVHMTPDGHGGYLVDEALVGGSNWGNHTPANDDGGGAFYGRDALGAARIFYRDQAFCRGDRKSPVNPAGDEGGAVQWRVTSPTAEGGGSTGILEAKISLTRDADEVYLNEFCFTHHDLLAATAAKGAAAHVRLDPNEQVVNKGSLAVMRAAGGEARWANTQMDPVMSDQKNHEKLDVYVKGGVPVALTIGSANDTSNGLDTTHAGVSAASGKPETHRTNHEIDAVVRRVTEGDYSTAPFLDAALAKTRNDLASRSLDTPPGKLSGTRPGQF